MSAHALARASKGGQTEVHQLQRDLTGIGPEGNECQAYMEKDAEVVKLLRGEKGSK
jgi:hypothetical protein